MIRETGCVPRCATPTYRLSVEGVFTSPSFFAATGNGTSNGTQNGREGDTTVGIAVPWPEFTVTSEYDYYSLSALLGDVGGMLGMLLGASIISLYDDAVEAGLKAWGKGGKG